MTAEPRPADLTPINVLTGFLGSGKTTLLQRLLADPAMANAAVLINEFGEVGLDHHLLDRIDDNVVLLKSGCLCCTVRGEVAEALQKLHSQRSRGEIPWFDRVVIETTGLADPFPALSTIQSHPVLRSHFAIANVVVTVDAVNGSRQLDERLEAVRQVGAADVVVITKTDMDEATGSDTLREKLSRLNPAARQVIAQQARVDDFLVDASVGRREEWLREALSASEQFAAPVHHHHHHHHHEEGDHHHHAHASVRSFSMVIEERIDWTGFGMWLTMLLNRHGDRVFRVKGILDIEGEERPVAIHGVQRLVHPPVHMSAWPDRRRQSRIVFIVDGLDPARIEESFHVFNRLSEKVLGHSRTSSFRKAG
ncbi:GTP-binding protein [Nitratireductor sp. ZSWI3]|uniref:CobW family GTP-binding protein n=1 Tax=Nitratireductor sp. ZSWI3 TaxID=2966359 RepID=UPI00214F9719|nr:GTP-binding protein [Nitratireductor sp. ZSWI3]MCR4268075.1 GTP-binding protein [Nitratireductor sp. ZSWI3]